MISGISVLKPGLPKLKDPLSIDRADQADQPSGLKLIKLANLSVSGRFVKLILISFFLYFIKQRPDQFSCFDV